MTSCWILSPSQLGHLERSYPRTEAAPTLSASYTGKPGPRERRELPCVSGRASTGTEGTPRLGLHLTVSLRPHTMRAGSSGLGSGGREQSKRPCVRRGDTHLLPGGTRDSWEALPAWLTLQENRALRSVCVAQSGPWPWRSPGNLKKTLEPNELGKGEGSW